MFAASTGGALLHQLELHPELSLKLLAEQPAGGGTAILTRTLHLPPHSNTARGFEAATGQRGYLACAELAGVTRGRTIRGRAELGHVASVPASQRVGYLKIQILTVYLDFQIHLGYRYIQIREVEMARHTAKLRAPADFGLAIQQARLGRGATQAEVASETDLRQSLVSEIESGKSTIYLRQLIELAHANGVELTASWDGEEPDAPRG